MTNAMIILMQSLDLMEQGILAATGEKVIVQDADGNNKELDLPEIIHTYARWKSLGYQVKKGEKAVAQFPIWKYTSKKTKEMSEEEAQEHGYCFLKKASFFKAAQVERMEVAE